MSPCPCLETGVTCDECGAAMQRHPLFQEIQAYFLKDAAGNLVPRLMPPPRKQNRLPIERVGLLAAGSDIDAG